MKTTIEISTAIFTALAALAAAFALFLSYTERKRNMKKDFILWAIARLREKDLREFRGKIFSLTKQQVDNLCFGKSNSTELDEIRLVCLSFDEIGYFVYKMGLVDFRDMLDIYPQAIKVWNRVTPIIEKWRQDQDDSTSFIYFEMLVRQKSFEPTHNFDTPMELYDTNYMQNNRVRFCKKVSIFIDRYLCT